MKNVKLIVFETIDGDDTSIGDNISVIFNVNECVAVNEVAERVVGFALSEKECSRCTKAKELLEYSFKQIQNKYAHEGVTITYDDCYDDYDVASGYVISMSRDYMVVRFEIIKRPEKANDFRIECNSDLTIETPITEHLYVNEEVNCIEKEETNMFSNMGKEFGKINSDQFRLSINGLSVKGANGKYFTFKPETRELVEVTTGFFDDMKDLLFIMPATELEVGDIILHQGKPYYISLTSETETRGIDFEGSIESTLIPTTNVFGIKYFTKVFNCLGSNNILGTDMASNPMMMYSLMGGKDFDLSKIMMFQAMSGQGKGISDFSENPMMLMALMSGENGGGELSSFAKMQMLTQLSAKKKEKEIKED